MKTPVMLLLAAALLVACNSTEPPATPRTVRFLFGLEGDTTGAENFIAATAVPAVIEQCRAELQKPPAHRALHINGPIARENAGRNLKWHWAHKPDEWQLVEMSVEVCDGRPSSVEADLTYWVDTVGRFCPWSSRVLQELP